MTRVQTGAHDPSMECRRAEVRPGAEELASACLLNSASSRLRSISSCSCRGMCIALHDDLDSDNLFKLVSLCAPVIDCNAWHSAERLRSFATVTSVMYCLSCKASGAWAHLADIEVGDLVQFAV